MILARYKPEIIGITGSVGKTSTKEAIYTVLASKFNVRRNIKNYNNEIGVPLTIIGADSPGKSLFGWLLVFLRALKLVLFKDRSYPGILVLELGVDRPGDMAYLETIIKPKVGVVTLIGPVHLEFFGSIEKIEKEKGLLIKELPLEGWAVLNYDDERFFSLAKLGKSRRLSYGFNEKAEVRAQELVFSFERGASGDNLSGLNFKLSYNGSTVPVMLPRVIGRAAVYSALAAAAVGVIYEMNLVEISRALHHFNPPKGRMKLIAGVKNTLIIDDSYNASPQSAAAALETIARIPLAAAAHKFAVLGDMLELGSLSEEGHRQVGAAAVKAGVDILIVVGERARDIGRGAEAAGLERRRIFHFSDSVAARLFVQDQIRQGDLILVKGSQGVRMEKIVKEIMAEPQRAKELLVRQDWPDA